MSENVIKNIDFNCDLAQVFGVYKNNTEFEVAKYMSSVGISTGFHAGDVLNIKKGLEFAKESEIAIGAHVGFDDISGFGSRFMELKDDEIEATLIYQIGAIKSFANAYKLNLEFVRPHGAMYRKTAQDVDFAIKIANSIKKIDEWLILYLPESEIFEEIKNGTNLRTASEIQLNKVYGEGEVVENNEIDFQINRLKKIIEEGKVNSVHFSNTSKNAVEIAKLATEIIKPTPVNFNNVVSSGWVE